jgi:hypothetical protein
MLGKCSTTELHPSPFHLFLLFWGGGLLQQSRCVDHRLAWNF